jgi:chromosome segregation ATPase
VGIELTSKLQELLSKLELPESTSIHLVLSNLESTIEQLEGKLRTIQSLLARTRELGQHEAELTQLSKQIATSKTDQSELKEKRVQLTSILTQLDTSSRDLAERRTQLSETQEAVPTDHDVAKYREDLTRLESELRALEREQGQTTGSATELDRALAEKTAEIAGAERKLQVVEASLKALLDAELESIGASRDMETVLKTEAQARRRRDELVLLKAKATHIKQQQRIIDENQALSKAQEQLRTAEAALKCVQQRQHRLQQRSTEFKELYTRLESLQNETAEIVLNSVRRPVPPLIAHDYQFAWRIRPRITAL